MTRLARNRWSRDCVLRIFLIVEQAPNINEEWLDSWLDKFDAMMDAIGGDLIEDARALSIEVPERFDRARLQEDKRLVIYADITYKLI